MEYIVELPPYGELGLLQNASDAEETYVESGSSTKDQPA